MAIYHFKAKAIQRSEGKNAVASAAYRHATKMIDVKEGQSFDYSNKHDVIHCEILIPDDSPQWLQDLVSEDSCDVHTASETLWNHVEQIEVRKDAQLSREFVFALPIELTQEQNIQLAREFIKDQLVLRGMVADWTVHWDEGNPHVHVMTSMRAISPEGFGLKVREWNDKLFLREWRQQWAQYANFHLRMHGHDMCIDHRSYKEQGIELVPGIHLGKAVTDMERRGIKTNLAQEANWICRENLTRIAANPDVLLDKMTRQQSSFSTEQLGQELGRYVNDRGAFSIVDKGILSEGASGNVLDDVTASSVLTPKMLADIFGSIEQHDSVFSDRELAMAVAKHTDNAELFARAILQLKASNSLIALGVGDDGRERYTTKQMFALENSIQQKADVLRDKAHVKISKQKIHRVLTDYQARTGKSLTQEQRVAVDHVLTPSSISCVVGRAGTGKSFSLGAAREVWQAVGLKVHGVALSGIAADGLSKDAAINSSTIESFRQALKSGKIVLDKYSVVVMDEAGMTDSHSMYAVLHAVLEAGAKLVLVGDHAQIQPVGPGASFRALLERLGFAELQQVYRQWQKCEVLCAATPTSLEDLDLLAMTANEAYVLCRDDQGQDRWYFVNKREQVCVGLLLNDTQVATLTERLNPNESARVLGKDELAIVTELTGHVQSQWQCQATVDFSAGRVKEALAAYHDKGCIRLSTTKDAAMSQLVNDWLAERERGQKDLSKYLVIAHRNEDVAKINQSIRAARVERGEISEGYRLNAKSGQIQAAQGDRLLFLKNDSRLGVKNGRFATIQSVDFSETGEARGLTVRLDGSHEVVSFTLKEYNDLALGYAAQDLNLGYASTVHKVQGMTVDHAFVYVSGLWNRCLAYVAMTRHKISCHVYSSGSYDQLEKKLDRYGIKDSLLDYPLAFAERRGIDTGFLLAGFPAHVRAKVAEFSENIAERLQLFLNPQAYHQKKAEQLDKAQKVTDAEARRQDARLVAVYVDAKKDTGFAWQAVQDTLFDLGFDAMPRDAESLEVITATDAYQAFLVRQAERNAFAAEILQAPDRYDKAIDIYGLELGTLQKQATQHDRLERVKQYQQEVLRGAVVHRGRLAAELLGAIQHYYPSIKALGLDSKVLRQHAQQHARRVHLSKLTPSERQAFARVEAYQQQLQKIGAYYHRFLKDKEMVSRVYALELEALNVERDRLASLIVADRASHTSALQFNGIGIKDTYDVPTEKQFEKRQKETILDERLTQHAKRRVLRERVECYQEACRSGTVSERGRLATEIRQDTKGHYAAMMQLGVTPDKDFWLGVWQDEQRYQRLLHLKGLDLVERAAFKTVEAYVDAKRAHGQAWAECFEGKKALSEPAQFAKMARYAQTYSQARNRLAHEIAANPAWYTKSLDYFKLSSVELQPQAYAHQCYVNVEQFAQGSSVLARAQAAVLITQDTKGHYPKMLEYGINWKAVYRHANIAQRQTLFATATREEKRLLRLTEEYRAANQRVGQYYGQIKVRTVEATVSKDTLSRLLAKRDALAHRLVDHKDTLEMKAAFGEYQATEAVQVHLAKRPLYWDKLETQAQKHIDKRQDVIALSDAYAESLDILCRLTEAKQGDALVEGVMGWRVFHDAQSIEALSQQVLEKPQAYQTLLAQQGVTVQQLKQRHAVMQNIQSTVNQWRAANQAQSSSQHERELTMDVAERIAKAKQIEKGSRLIQGTLAERYLREHRGIQGQIPDSYRYHPGVYHGELKQKCPTLVVVAKNEHNQTQAVQVIFLDKDTANKAKVKSAKLTYGRLSDGKIGVLANLGDNTHTIAIAEGPETALSIAEARPDLRVYAVLGSGNIARAPIDKDTKTVLICADNDGANSASHKKILATAEHYALQGLDVQQAMPEGVRQDFNDVLKAEGKAAVKAILDKPDFLTSGVRQEDLTKRAAEAVNQLLHPEKVEVSLESLLKDYVAMCLEQTRLVDEKLMAMVRDDGTERMAAAQTIEHDKHIVASAIQMMKHPEMARMLTDKNRVQPLVDLGGYPSIYKRFVSGQFSAEDIRTVAEQIRNKAQAHARTQNRDQSRGGRSQ